MDDFITVFQLSPRFDQTILAGFILGLVLASAGTVGLIVGRRRATRLLKRHDVLVLAVVVGSIFFIVSSVSIIRTSIETEALLSAYNDGRYDISEGIVHVKHQQPEEGHDRGDVITINGEELEIDYFSLTPAYSRTISHGGALKEGVHARVYHFDQEILRIDILKGEGRDEARDRVENSN